jgi:hypothetical protein
MGLFNRPKVDGDLATFKTGCKRSAQGVRYDLLTPIGLRAVAEAAHEGSIKYGDHNIEKGLPVSVLLNHALAHIYCFLEGETTEIELSHAAWNLLFAIHSLHMWPHLNTDLRQAGCKPPKESEVAHDAE